MDDIYSQMTKEIICNWKASLEMEEIQKSLSQGLMEQRSSLKQRANKIIHPIQEETAEDKHQELSSNIVDER